MPATLLNWVTSSIFFFSPYANGDTLVQSYFYDSFAICHHNPGVQPYSTPGQYPGTARIPARILEACRHEANYFNGFFLLHGPQNRVKGPVILYSVYPLNGSRAYERRAGQVDSLLTPQNRLAISSGRGNMDLSIRPASTDAYSMPMQGGTRSSGPSFSIISVRGQVRVSQCYPPSIQAQTMRKDNGSKQSGVSSSNPYPAKSKRSLSIPPLVMSEDMIEVDDGLEARLKALEVGRQIEEARTALQTGQKTPRRAFERNTSSRNVHAGQGRRKHSRRSGSGSVDSSSSRKGGSRRRGRTLERAGVGSLDHRRTSN